MSGPKRRPGPGWWRSGPSAVVVVLAALLVQGDVPEASAGEAQAVVDRLAKPGLPQLVAAVSELARMADRVPPDELEAALRAIAARPGLDPLVAAQVDWLVASAEEARGDGDAATRRRKALGLLEEAWVLGPFDGQGRDAIDQAWPPEAEAAAPVLDREHAGKERPVRWRKADGAFREGALLIDALLRPDRDATAYVLYRVRRDRAGKVAFRIGSAGPVKVWVNGALVITRNAARSARLDQDVAGVTLRAGENVVLVKSVSGDASWRVIARITALDGRASAGAGKAAAAYDLGATLRRSAERAGGGAKGAAAFRAYAEYLALVAPDDADEKSIEAAARRAVEAAGEQAPGTSANDRYRALLLLGELAADDNDRREALEQALPLAPAGPERARVLAALGDLARVARRDAAAFALWRQALQEDPACWQAALALAGEEQGAGLTAAGWARVQALPPPVLAIPRVRRTAARLLEALGRPEEAYRTLLEGWPLRRTDVELTQTMAALARMLGRPRDAAAHVGASAALRPELVFFTLEHARALEGLGDAAAAERVLEEAAARLPDEPRLAEELGKLQARRGNRERALSSLRRALELRPQNPTLRRYVERLAATDDEGARARVADLARRHADDAEALVRGWASASKSQPKNASHDKKATDPAEVLLDRRVVRVHENGLSEVFAQRVVAVRTERGARDQARFYVRYTPGDQEVEIRRARIFRPGEGGALEVIEASGRQDQDLSEPWYGLYYDNRALVVELDGLRAGDVLEVQYTVADTASRNELATYFGDLQFVAETIPTRQWDYTLIGPRKRTFFFHVPTVPGLVREEQDQGGEHVTRFLAREVARIESEPSMPGFAEVAPYLHVSTYRTWQDVGRWYWSLVAGQLLADESVRRAAYEATRGLAAELDKVRALHNLVLSGTRYVGLEFGIHGYKPFRVSQVLARRFGDCKDKASLLVALLREVGIEAQLVLLRTRRGGRLATEPASLAVFDHAIAYVPKLDLYLDGTAEFSGLEELPAQDQGVTVLRVDARTALLTETPVLASVKNRAARRWEVALAADGSGKIRERLTVEGQAAPDWRQHYETPGERADRYGKVWNGRLPGTRLVSVAMEGITDRNRPVEVTAELEVPGLAQVRGEGTLELPVAARDAEFVRSYARLGARKHELVLGFPWRHEETLVITLPEGFRAARLPASREERSPFGTFSFTVTPSPDGRTLEIRSTVDVVRHRVPPAEYPEFRRFLGTIDATLGSRVWLERERVSAAAPEGSR